MNPTKDKREKQPHCRLCCCINRPLLCADCFNSVRLSLGNRLLLAELQSQRNSCLAQLEKQMQKRLLYDQRMAREAALHCERQKLRQRAYRAEQHLKSVRARILEMTTENEKRFEELRKYAKRLSQCTSTHLIPNQERPYETALLRACESEKHTALKHGLLFLVKAIELRRTSDGPEIMGVSLPKFIHPMPDMPLDVKKNLGALMGYVCLFVQHLSQCLDVPLLHVSQFECSTSHVMKPERIFDQRKNPRWMKHRLYLSQDNLDHEGNWQELVAGVQLMKRSLMCLAASMSTETFNESVSLFDLLLFILTRFASDKEAPEPKIGALGEGEGSELSQRESDDDWCEVDSMILPPPPSAEDDICHYEAAMAMNQVG